MICHQRKIRDEIAETDDRPVATLAGAYVSQITREQAESVILVYEWLGTMPKVTRACYGLFTADADLIGVAIFGNGGGSNARNLCGEERAGKAICLERGACVHWAHPHAASFLISRACKLAAQDHGWRVFYAYSDVEAGEIGTVYQACNWIHLGQNPGRSGTRYRYKSPDGERYASRRWRAMRKRLELSHEPFEYWQGLGWTRDKEPARHKYCHFEGDKRERRALRKALKYEPQPYPKRGHT